MTIVLMSVLSCHRVAVDLEEWQRSCTQRCEHLFECWDPPFPDASPELVDPAQCHTSCMERSPEPLECADDDVAYYDCLTSLSCEEFAIFLDDPFAGEPDQLCFEVFWAASVCRP